MMSPLRIGDTTYTEQDGGYVNDEGERLTCARCGDPLPIAELEWRFGPMEIDGPQHRGTCPAAIKAAHEAYEKSVLDSYRRKGWTILPPEDSHQESNE